MKHTLKFLLLISIIALMVGCKLAVIVVEGGEVKSLDSGICAAGNICIVEVTDTDFSEGFDAVPDKGWYFQKWNSGDRFFCGGSTYTRCALSFQGHEESEAVADMVASSELFYLMPVFTTDPGATKVGGTSRTIEVDGEERLWLKPKDFTNYSYNQVSRVCPDGVCSGSLPGSSIDLTGYTWASGDDIRLLFNAYQDAGISILEEFEYTTMDKGPTLILYAMLSEPPYEDPEYDRVYVAVVLGGEIHDATQEVHDMGHFPIEPSQRGSYFGAWFWRPSG